MRDAFDGFAVHFVMVLVLSHPFSEQGLSDITGAPLRHPLRAI
jgi:hypothetical protein